MSLKNLSKGNNFMILLTSSSNIISSALTIIAGLIALKWLLPSELGYFNTFTVMTGYIVLAHIGIPVALSRDLPYLIGKGDKEEALQLAAVSKYWTFFISLFFSVIGAIVLLYYLFIVQDYRMVAGIIVIIFQTWQGFFVTKYLKILYRTNKDFNKLSLITLISGVTTFVSIYFIYKYGFYGLCIRAIIIVLIDFIFTWYWRPIRVTMHWDKFIFLKLLKIGFPIFIVTNIYGKWPLVERTIILLLLGTNALGLFTIVFVIGNAFSIFASSISTVLYPTMMIDWGKGMSIGAIFKTKLLKPLLFVILLFVIISPLLWFFLPKSIIFFIPKYKDIIEASKWMILTGFMGIFNILAIFYNVINAQKKRLFMYLSGVFVWGLILITAYWFHLISFELFPKALFVGYFVMTLININFLKNNWSKTQLSYG